jgi:hypothetical protein
VNPAVKIQGNQTKAFHPVMQLNATTNAKLHPQNCVEGVSHQFTDPAFLP